MKKQRGIILLIELIFLGLIASIIIMEANENSLQKDLIHNGIISAQCTHDLNQGLLHAYKELRVGQSACFISSEDPSREPEVWWNNVKSCEYGHNKTVIQKIAETPDAIYYRLTAHLSCHNSLLLAQMAVSLKPNCRECGKFLSWRLLR